MLFGASFHGIAASGGLPKNTKTKFFFCKYAKYAKLDATADEPRNGFRFSLPAACTDAAKQQQNASLAADVSIVVAPAAASASMLPTNFELQCAQATQFSLWRVNIAGAASNGGAGLTLGTPLVWNDEDAAALTTPATKKPPVKTMKFDASHGEVFVFLRTDAMPSAEVAKTAASFSWRKNLLKEDRVIDGNAYDEFVDALVKHFSPTPAASHKLSMFVFLVHADKKLQYSLLAAAKIAIVVLIAIDAVFIICHLFWTSRIDKHQKRIFSPAKTATDGKETALENSMMAAATVTTQETMLDDGTVANDAGSAA